MSEPVSIMQTRFAMSHRKASKMRMSGFLVGTTLKLLKAIFQAIVCGLRGEVQAGLKRIREDVKEVLSNTVKVLDHNSIRLDSIESIMPFADV